MNIKHLKGHSSVEHAEKNGMICRCRAAPRERLLNEMIIDY